MPDFKSNSGINFYFSCSFSSLLFSSSLSGYKLIVTMPRLQAMAERYILIRAFGGQVRLSDPQLKSQGFLDLAEQIAKETPNSFLMRQFTNPANIAAHAATTGPEILRQTQGDVDAVVAGIGTGGTIIGVASYLKAQASTKDVHIVGVEPTESRVLQGHKHRVHSIVGIGTGLRVPMITALDPGKEWIPGGRGVIDEFVSVSTKESLDMALLLSRQVTFLFLTILYENLFSNL